jgi:hypothetical protein
MKPKKKIKIGVIGENFENDAEALCILLQKRAFENTYFKALNIKGVTADNIESAIAVGKRVIGEIAKEELKYVICMKDLDAIITDKQKLSIKDLWFSKFHKTVGKEAISYLAIAETEALLLADIAVINKKYGTDLKKYTNSIGVSDPKKELKTETSKKSKNPYIENDCKVLMNDINFEEVFKNHKGERSFQVFATDLANKKILDANILKHK